MFPSPPPRRRNPLSAILVALLPVMLLLGIWLGGHPSLLPDTIRDVFVDDEDAQSIEAVLDLIEDDYYRPVDRERLVDSSLEGLVGSLNDRFSAYFDPKEYDDYQDSTNARFSGVGITVAEHPQGLRVTKVFPDSPAARAKIRVGDLVVAANGRPLKGRTSAQSTALIKGRPGTRVSLTVESDGRRRVERLTRAQISFPVVESSLRTVDGVRLADIELSSFTSGSHGELRAAIDRARERGAKGIVLDLRGNGGGLLQEAVLVSSIFLEEGTVVVTDGRTRGRRTFKASGSSIPGAVPVVVLVDRGSASASEIVAGALQDRDRAEVVGTRTFGKGVFQEIVELPNGGAVELTVGEYFTPKGRNVGGGGIKQGRGLPPDVRAQDDPRTGRDEALDVALRTLAAEVRGR